MQQADEEVGITEIRRGPAFLFVSVWLLILVVVFAVDHLKELSIDGLDSSATTFRSLAVVKELPEVLDEIRHDVVNPSSWITANRRLLKRMQDTEDDIDEHGAVAAMLRPWVQKGLLLAGVGNEEVYLGKDSWLFYRQDVDSVTGPGFLDEAQLQKRAMAATEFEKSVQANPLHAIIDFHQQLSVMGIQLVLVPVPVKPEILPDMFSSRFPKNSVVQNPSYQLFIDQLRIAGIQIADVAGWLSEYQQQEQQPAFLVTDTHWTPAAMQMVSFRLAEELDSCVSWNDAKNPTVVTETKTVANTGDIAGMLDLPETQDSSFLEDVEITRVITTDGGAWKADNTAELLVLGDSFSNTYSLNSMGWGESAGFVEHLSYQLQRPVDRIVQNSDGAFATRQILARELARGRDRLAGKQVVVFQFATRELALGDWQKFPLLLSKAKPSNFLSIKPGEQLHVRGIVQEISNVPRPGSVPYADHVVSIHLVDIQHVDNQDSFSQAVVFMRSMVKNVWTNAARIRPGDEIELTLGNWYEVSGELDGLNRSELDELELQLQEPVWGELKNE